MTKEELVQSLRRQSKGYHQNSSQYRGVTKHQKGKWEARIGQVLPPPAPVLAFPRIPQSAAAHCMHWTP